MSDDAHRTVDDDGWVNGRTGWERRIPDSCIHLKSKFPDVSERKRTIFFRPARGTVTLYKVLPLSPFTHAHPGRLSKTVSSPFGSASGLLFPLTLATLFMFSRDVPESNHYCHGSSREVGSLAYKALKDFGYSHV